MQAMTGFHGASIGSALRLLLAKVVAITASTHGWRLFVKHGFSGCSASARALGDPSCPCNQAKTWCCRVRSTVSLTNSQLASTTLRLCQPNHDSHEVSMLQSVQMAPNPCRERRTTAKRDFRPRDQSDLWPWASRVVVARAQATTTVPIASSANSVSDLHD